jgi:hypothetical protein
MTYVIESGIALANRPKNWTVTDENIADRNDAYRLMVLRALLLKALYEPHGGRRLRVREIKP